ncbi:hypothetical protein Trydic_g14350 [Trypoxylus dichotomus]
MRNVTGRSKAAAFTTRQPNVVQRDHANTNPYPTWLKFTDRQTLKVRTGDAALTDLAPVRTVVASHRSEPTIRSPSAAHHSRYLFIVILKKALTHNTVPGECNSDITLPTYNESELARSILTHVRTHEHHRR